MIITLPLEAVRNYLIAQLQLNYPFDEAELHDNIDTALRDYFMLMISPAVTYHDLCTELQRSLADIGYPAYRFTSLHDQINTLMINVLSAFLPRIDYVANLRYLGKHTNGRIIVEITSI